MTVNTNLIANGHETKAFGTLGHVFINVVVDVILQTDRFAGVLRIVQRSARVMKTPITDDGAAEIAKRSRGTPRIANRLLRRVRDYALVRADGRIDGSIADAALTMLGVDRLGLDELDRRILRVIGEDFGGGPVGVRTIAISVGEEVRTVEEVYEPYLIQIGFIKRTPQGREITEAARRHIEGG